MFRQCNNCYVILFLGIVTSFLLNSTPSLTQYAFWDSIKTEQQYFAALDSANEATFYQEFEYPFLLLLNEQQKKYYLNSSSLVDRKKFIRTYWKAWNPNPLLPENDWLMVFVKRCVEVKRHFSTSEPPFFDDRGKYFLKYGKPTYRYEDSASQKKVDILRDKRISELLKQLYFFRLPDEHYNVLDNETWVYNWGRQNLADEFVIHFVRKEDVFREVQSLNDVIVNSNKNDLIWYWSDLLKKRAQISPLLLEVANEIEEVESDIWLAAYGSKSSGASTKGSIRRPHLRFAEQKSRHEKEFKKARMNLPASIYAPDQPFNQLNFSFEIAQFQGANRETRIEISFLTPIEKNLIERNESPSIEKLIIEYSSLLRDQIFNPVIKENAATSFPAKLTASEKLPNAVGYLSFSVLPQKGELSLQVYNNRTDNRLDKIGFFKQNIDIQDFNSNNLMISDIQFFLEATPPDETQFIPIHEKNSIKVIPYPYRAIRKTLPVFCYFEIYNIKTAGIDTEFEITLKVLSEKQHRGIFNKFFKWLTGSKDSPQNNFRF